MNYIKQINAFYNRIEQEPLASSSVSLWYTLMHINNKAMWQESFTVSGTVLKYKGGLSDSSFKRARIELQEKGYITWESRGSLAPIYRVVPLAFESDDNQDKGNPHDPDSTYDKEAAATVTDVEPSIDIQENAAHVSESIQVEETDVSDWKALSVQNGTSPGNDDMRDPVFDADAIRSQEASKTETDSWGHNDTPSFISETNATYPNKHTNHRSNIDTHSEPDDDTNPLSGRYVDHHADQSMDHNADQSAGHLPDHEPDPLVKQDKTKKDETKPKETKKAAAAVLHFFEDNFGVAGPFVKASIVSWLEDLGEGLVLRAMERSLESGKATWAYTKGILRAWLDKGIRSVGDAEVEESAFRRDKWHSGGAGGVMPGEVVPDWFRELERKREVVSARECVDVRDEAEVLRETQAMLDAFVGV